MFNIKDIHINIPKYPNIIISELKKNGFDAYIVGGCVRDSILGYVPSDYDITTNATPYDVKRIFKRTIDTGIKHGTISVLFYDEDKPLTFEVTTYRIDGEYDDARHPKDVLFVKDLKEDLLRRDFTVNAMAYNNDTGLIDEFGGLVDLQKKIIKAVGNPIDRFNEDALRLMRTVRFASKLGFEIDEDTKNAVPMCAHKLQYVSKERVQIELTKTITSDNPMYVKKLFELGLASYITKNFASINVGNIAKKESKHIAYASLLFNTDIAVANGILKELKLDNDTISKVLMILSAKNTYNALKERPARIEFEVKIKSLINNIGYELSYDFVKILFSNVSEITLVQRIKDNIDLFKIEKHPIFLNDLKITGNDMIDVGFKGEEIGLALMNLQAIVFRDRSLNAKNKLINIAKKAYKLYKGE